MVKLAKDHWELRGAHNRRFSCREYAVLQSFDENFEPDGVLPAKYAQIGNAVPTRIAEQIVPSVVAFLNSQFLSEKATTTATVNPRDIA